MRSKKAGLAGAALVNEMKMKLLASLPSFQREVLAIRSEFGIPEGGWGKNDEAYGAWYHQKFLVQSDQVQNSKEYTEKERVLKAENWAGKISHAEYKKRKWELLDMVPVTAMAHRLERFRGKYHLPENFITTPRGGVRWYIERGEVVSPGNNWMITPDPETRKGTAKWISIKTFSPLTKQEIADAVAMLESIQSHYFPPSVNIPLRSRQVFERDLRMVSELRSRTGHPVLREQLAGYLKDLQKSYGDSAITPEMRKIYKHQVVVDYDQPTSKRVGKKEGAKPATTRKAIQRLDRLAKKLFDTGFA